VGIIAFIYLVALIGAFAKTLTGADFTLASLLAFLIIYLYFVRPARNMERKLWAALQAHEEVLVRKQAQLQQRDAYGNLQDARWVKEIDQFLVSTVLPGLGSLERTAFTSRRAKLNALVKARIDDVSVEKPAFREFSDDHNHTHFELFCAEELKQSGWDVRVTKGSRDQGVDVVAQKSGLRLVVQCKLYSRPVGNKAVQEVVAARAHEGAQAAAVVTNNEYTQPARELAATNGVLLLH
jgi:restriction system protein